MAATIHRLHKDVSPRQWLAPEQPKTLAAPKKRRTAAQLYPLDSRALEALARCGVGRIYGVFDWQAWRATTAAAGLYLLPIDGRAHADLRQLGNDTHAIMRRQKMWQYLFLPPARDRAIAKHVRKQTLLPTIFPGFSAAEPSEHTTPVTVRFPAPGADEWRTIHAARLAGYTMGVACPADAIRVVGLSEAVRQSDPIVFGWRTEDRARRAVVFTHYAASPDDSEALRTLVVVLKGMATDL